MIDLYNGDCLEVMRSIADNSIDLTVTSPPYDNLRSYNGNNELWNEQVWKNVIAELYRITKQGGVVVWVVGDTTIKGSETGTSFRQALWAMGCGFNLHDTMIYEKKAHVYDPRQHRYKHTIEFMFIFSKGKPKSFNPICDIPVKHSGSTRKVSQRLKNGTLRKDRTVTLGDYQARGCVWYYENGASATSNKVAFEHPAIYPEKLARDHILSWSNEGDTVLDCFMGSGTTGAMAIETGRKFIGIELDKHYFDVATKRINEHKAALDALF